MANRSVPPNRYSAPEVAQPGAQGHAGSVFAAQRELFDSLQQMNEHWLAQVESEAVLAKTLAGKLAAARSLPDVTGAYRDWFAQRLEKYVEDSNQVLLDVQRVFESGTGLVRDGSAANPKGRDAP